jgi:2-polyprenyl-6-hydroxyphenyl methylase/3-demethylubiquinone-9 3-methyltransferase
MHRSTHGAEVDAGRRFQFGKNWQSFLDGLNDTRIVAAERSLKSMLGLDQLHGKRFVDVGSGSGLFSLAARRLGAQVHSLDYDPESVACTAELRRRYFPGDTQWTVESGSALDADYLRSLGSFDIVYSWGVLHHTGEMHRAFDRVAKLVAPGGLLFIAIYNDQGWLSRYWLVVKRAYNRSALLRYPLIALHLPHVAARWLVRRLRGRAPLDRGMSLWHDMLDWIGGYPFEVATPEAVFEHHRGLGFTLIRLKTCGGRMGCNEFVFRRD